MNTHDAGFVWLNKCYQTRNEIHIEIPRRTEIIFGGHERIFQKRREKGQQVGTNLNLFTANMLFQIYHLSSNC